MAESQRTIPQFVRRLFPKVSALAEEMRTRRLNYIKIHMAEDRSSVILTTVIEDEPLAWITYNTEQLDELIRLLESYRKDLL